MNDFDFYSNILGLPDWMTPFRSLRDLGRPWPTPEMVNEVCYRIERQCQAEQAEADSQERRKLEDGE